MPVGDLVDRWDYSDKDLVARRLILSDAQRSFGEALRNEMRERHDFVAYGVGSRLESVGVPFPHVVLTGGDDLRREQDRVQNILQQAFGAYVDPLVGLRARYFEPADPWNVRAAFFGRGVFVPEAGETPCGAALIRSARGGEETPIRLPAADGAGVPAGFYRGQNSLAFAWSERYAPAAHGALPDDPVIFHLAPQKGIGRASEDDLSIFDRPPPGEPRRAAHLYSRKAVALDDSTGLFAAIDVSREGRPAFRLVYALDRRPSALRTASDASWSLRITGLVAPATPLLRRWWIDLDAEGRLVSSAAVAPARSIICEGRSVCAYDWNRRAFEDHPEWELVSARAGGGWILQPKSGFLDLGALSPPNEACRVSFGEGGPGLFELDWLDFAGAVQRPAAEPVRLARWWAARDRRRQTIFPGLSTARGLLQEIPVRRRNVGFGEWDGRWAEGLEFRVGPLVLTVVAGGPVL